MAVDRLSVTVPSALGEALRALAQQRKTTVSNVVAEALAHEIRMAALDGALAEADRRFGPIPPRRLARAEAELVEAMQPRKPRKRR
jgi:hypothetical protein